MLDNRKLFVFMSAMFLVSCSLASDTHKVETTSPDQTIVSSPPTQVIEESGFSCPHQEQREIFFSSNEIKDALHIQIIGDDCDTAKINLRIITSSGDVIHNTTARALSYTYDAEGARGVEYMLNSLVSTSSQLNAFPENLSDLTERNGYHKVNIEAVKAAKNNDLPFFCHVAGKSFSNCFVFWQGKTTFAYSSGS